MMVLGNWRVSGPPKLGKTSKDTAEREPDKTESKTTDNDPEPGKTEDKTTGNDFDSYRQEQAAWLEKALQSEEVASAKYKVVMMHIPPIAGVAPVSKDLNALYLPILEKAGITLMVCGYTHNSQMHEASKKCNFPILENGSHTLLNIRATDTSMEVIVEDFEGKELNKYTF